MMAHWWQFQSLLQLFLLFLLVEHGQTTQLIDLSHTMDNTTIFWPTAQSLKRENKNYYEHETWHSVESYCMAEHGGTHMDAPAHFARYGLPVSDIPVEKLFAPGVMIDVSHYTALENEFRLTEEHLKQWETEHGTIPKNAVILMNFGWAKYWKDSNKYLGGSDAASLKFPGIHPSAAKWISEHRSVSGIGLDTASMDYGASSDFETHVIFTAAGIYGLENMNNLNKLPATGFTVVVMPMKISSGSGGPCRVVALINEYSADSSGCRNNFSLLSLLLVLSVCKKLFHCVPQLG